MSSFWWLVERAGGVAQIAARGKVAHENYLAMVAYYDEVRRATAYFADGTWHSAAQIIEEFGSNSRAILDTLLGYGNSFVVSGAHCRMVPHVTSDGPLRRGTIDVMDPMPRTTSITSTDENVATVGEREKEATKPNSSNPESVLATDGRQPDPEVLPSSSTAARAMPAGVPTEQDPAVAANEPLAAATGTGMAVTAEPKVATVTSIVEATKACPVGTRQPASNPTRELAKSSGTTPRQNTQSQAPRSYLPNTIHIPKAPDTGNYVWLNSPTAADLIGHGIVPYYKNKYVAVDIKRNRSTIARINVIVACNFFHYFKVGLAREVEDGDSKVARYDEIEWYPVRNRYGLHVVNEDLVKVASKIASFPKSLPLRKDQRWSLPKFPGKPARDFAIRSRWDNTVCVPMIVGIERRKTSEPLVEVHLYAWHKDYEGQPMVFCGMGYTSWHSAIVLAHGGVIGAKVALPKGGWKFVELLADVRASAEGVEYGRGLKLNLNSLPEVARQWASSFPSIFDVPLSKDYADWELDWTHGFPPVPKKK